MGDKQDVKDRELTQVQIYKFFTFVQKKTIILQISSFLLSTWREVGAEPASELLSVSRTYAREARAHAHGLQTISSAGPPNSPPDLPSHPKVCFAQIFISGIYGRDGKPSLTCQRTPSATMAPYRGAKRYLRCLFIEFEAKEKAPTSP